MSNVLTIDTIRATKLLAEANPLPAHMVALLAIGLCVMLVWMVRRMLHPQKLRLLGSPGRPNSLNLALAYVVIIAYVTMVYVLGWLIGDLANGMIIANIGAQIMCICLSLAIAWWAFKGRIRRGLGLTLRHWKMDSIRGIVAYLAVLPICYGLLIVTQWIAELISGPIVIPIHPLLQAARDGQIVTKILAMVSAMILAPLAEEILFRGLLQSMVRKYTGKPWVAIGVASLIFVLMHASQWHTLPSIAALSIVLGYNYERSGRLAAPIVTHMLFNMVFMLTTIMQSS